MENAKYVTIESPLLGLFAVIFHPIVNHSDMRDIFPGGKIVSSGFVSIGYGIVQCHGKSVSLGIGPGPMDEGLIKKMLWPLF